MKTAREEIAELCKRAAPRYATPGLAAALLSNGCDDDVARIIDEAFDVLLTRIERQAEVIVELQRRVRELDNRTLGSIRVGGR